MKPAFDIHGRWHQRPFAAGERKQPLLARVEHAIERERDVEVAREQGRALLLLGCIPSGACCAKGNRRLEYSVPPRGLHGTSEIATTGYAVFFLMVAGWLAGGARVVGWWRSGSG